MKLSYKFSQKNIILIILFYLFLFSGIGRLAATFDSGNEVIVLCYHSFFGNKKYDTDFSLSELRKHIDLLKKKGYEFVSYDDVSKGLIQGKKNILVTIDDGNRSAFTAYEKVFKKEKIKPMFAIYPYAINRFPFMTWEQIRVVSRDGCEIASHGYKHRPMTEYRLTHFPEQILEELLLSRKMIFHNINKKVRAFVYPYGIHEANMDKLVEMADYDTAFGLDHYAVKFPLSGNRNKYLLPRYMLLRSNAEKVLNGFP